MRRLLDHERLRKGTEAPVVKPVDLHALASNVISQSQRYATAKRLSLAVEVPPGAVVMTDPDLLTLVLQNLVGNAVKYSEQGMVRVGAQQRAAGKETSWSVWISDEGPGIKPQDKQRIFDAFRRGDVRGHQGVGLGLAIATQAANLLGATLTWSPHSAQARHSHSRYGRNRQVRYLKDPRKGSGGV